MSVRQRTDAVGRRCYKAGLPAAETSADVPTPPRNLHRVWRWLALVLAVIVLLPVLLVLGTALFGANWARGPLQAVVLQRTGRALQIGGDLDLVLAWPLPRLRAQALRYANPAWATAPQMLSADTVEMVISAPQLLLGRLAFAELRLLHPQFFLEQASGGRKTWLLDLQQTDDEARIPIGRVQVEDGEITYVDHGTHTALHAALSTRRGPESAEGLAYTVYGQFRGQPLEVKGTGGAVLGWRDETTPYPLKLQATLGRTKIDAAGTVTSLLQLSAVDLRVAISGDSLASLFPALGIALPPSPAYAFTGQLQHSGTQWRYQAFSGRIGHSDLAGSLQVQTAGARPLLTGTFSSKHLDPADLGPAVGVTEVATNRVLPDLPFDPARWASLDADVSVDAQSFLRAGALPLDRLHLRLQLQDRLLTMDPLDFGVAGGQVHASIALDGRAQPLQGRIKMQLRGLKLSQLLPAADSPQARIGRVHGDAQLVGQGASVGKLLATANGRLTLVAQGGEISRLLMEQVGLHLLEILRLNLTGDQAVPLRCALADFGIENGRMTARALVLDTSINTVVGSGGVNLADETLDLTLVPHTKVASLLALRSPIHLRGSFREPAVSIDAGQLAARGLGALLLGLVNPLLAIVPLFEAGPGLEGGCASLAAAAKTTPK